MHEALKFAKRQWDEIFSVNAHGVAHQPVVDIVAPYIRDPFGCVLPDLTACHLFNVGAMMLWLVLMGGEPLN